MGKATEREREWGKTREIVGTRSRRESGKLWYERMRVAVYLRAVRWAQYWSVDEGWGGGLWMVDRATMVVVPTMVERDEGKEGRAEGEIRWGGRRRRNGLRRGGMRSGPVRSFHVKSRSARVFSPRARELRNASRQGKSRDGRKEQAKDEAGEFSLAFFFYGALETELREARPPFSPPRPFFLSSVSRPASSLFSRRKSSSATHERVLEIQSSRNYV